MVSPRELTRVPRVALWAELVVVKSSGHHPDLVVARGRGAQSDMIAGRARERWALLDVLPLR